MVGTYEPVRLDRLCRKPSHEGGWVFYNIQTEAFDGTDVHEGMLEE